MADTLVATHTFTLFPTSTPTPTPTPASDVLVATKDFIILYQAPEEPPGGDVMVASKDFTILYKAIPNEPPGPEPEPDEPDKPDTGEIDWGKWLLIGGAGVLVTTIVLGMGDKK